MTGEGLNQMIRKESFVVRTEQKVEEAVEMRPACAEGTGRNPGEYASGAYVCPRTGGDSNPEAQELLEQIVAPENMRKAWKQVKRNKGWVGRGWVEPSTKRQSCSGNTGKR